MLNRVILIGRLTRDPELRYSPSGVAVTNFTLAVDRKFKNAQVEKEADFIPCVAFKQLGELAANWLAKGKQCSVDGRMQTRNYTNKDGQKVYVTEVICEDIHFLSPKDAQQGDNNVISGNPSYGTEVSIDDGDCIPF